MEVRPVKIYSTENVPRLRYIAGMILENLLGLSWEVITDKRKLGKHPVINYSSENISDSFKISPDTLLFEKYVITIFKNKKRFSIVRNKEYRWCG